MELKLSVPEVVDLFKAIQPTQGSIFEMVRMNVQEEVGNYLSKLMGAELSHFLGREKYEHGSSDGNYRNGGYERKFCLKGIGEVTVRVPRDRQSEYKTKVLPRSQRYETSIAEDLTLLYLTGISTRTLSLLSKRLIGRKLCAEEVSRANRELTDLCFKEIIEDGLTISVCFNC
jgi:putative transposase